LQNLRQIKLVGKTGFMKSLIGGMLRKLIQDYDILTFNNKRNLNREGQNAQQSLRMAGL